jgi:hypothetical protein
MRKLVLILSLFLPALAFGQVVLQNGVQVGSPAASGTYTLEFAYGGGNYKASPDFK